MQTFNIEAWYRKGDTKDFELFQINEKSEQEAVNKLAKKLSHHYFAFFINNQKIKPQ